MERTRANDRRKMRERIYMNEFVLEVRYPAGVMRIIADQVFPCTKKELKIILGSLDKNPDWRIREKTVKELREWLLEKIRETENEDSLRDLANKAVDFRTMANELDDPIEKQKKLVSFLEILAKQTKSKPDLKKAKSDLKDEKEKLKGLTEKRKYYLSASKSCETDIVRMQKRAAKLKENMEMLDGYLGT